MNIIIYTDTSKHVVENRIVVGEPDWLDSKYAGRWEISAHQDAPVVLNRTLTKLEYMDRFTDPELEAIYTAAKASVAVEVWLEKFKQATDINLDDERTVAGLNKLKDAGILTAQRVAEILA